MFRVKIESDIVPSSLEVVDKVDIKTVKAAVSNMKPNKSDSVFDVTSDMYIYGPDIFFQHLAKILRQSIIHGVLPHIVMICTLMPLIKDSLGDLTKSDNYRAIAGCCLVLKVLDLVILNLEGDKFKTDALQFAYKAKTGTSARMWTVTAIVDYFTRDGKPIYGASMDMSKAFDMVKWKELFSVLLERGVQAIFLRFLIFIYRNQEYMVKWGERLATSFGVSNGVRQGGVCSGIFFVVYIDNLIELLRASGFGCTIHGVFYGVTIYADDIFLLSASRTGLQEMVKISQVFTSKMNLKFGTNINIDKSKTKCMIFSKKKKDSSRIKEIVLDGCRLPWVSQVKHLGHALECNNTMAIDINQK